MLIQRYRRQYSGNIRRKTPKTNVLKEARKYLLKMVHVVSIIMLFFSTTSVVYIFHQQTVQRERIVKKSSGKRNKTTESLNR